MVNGAPQASIVAPTLPKGWVYEGWVVVNGNPVSTGRFTAFNVADSDGPGPAGGPLGSPPFPGQDFVNPPTKLPGGTAVISVEPEPDNSPAPFTLKPLVGPIGASLAPTVQTLNNTVGSRVRIQVNDNGCGIAEQDLPHIFERYWTTRISADDSPRPSISSGLGLAIVRRILELHGSSINVRSALQRDTEFSFALPAAG